MELKGKRNKKGKGKEQRREGKKRKRKRRDSYPWSSIQKQMGTAAVQAHCTVQELLLGKIWAGKDIISPLKDPFFKFVSHFRPAYYY